MFRKIKSYLLNKRTKRQLRAVLNLLYSIKKFEIDELINELDPKDKIEILEYYIIIEMAAKLQRPFTINNISKIWEEEVKALESYVASKELRVNILELWKTKAALSLLHFNFYMNNLRQANDFNKYSSGGMLFRSLIAKGRPLTESEELKVNESYKEIKRLDDLASQKMKELEELVKKKN